MASDEVEFDCQTRPDRTEAMKQTHTNAATCDTGVRAQVQETIDDPRVQLWGTTT